MQVLAAAEVGGVGVRHQDGEQLPAVLVEDLAHLAARVLVVAAVHQADPALDLEKADFRGAVYIITALTGADEFIHMATSFFDTLHH